MAKKKSGAQQRKRARTMGFLSDGKWCGKRGRPKGETTRHQELQAQIHKDLAWLGLPYKPDLHSYLAKNLPDPNWRTSYLLTPPECPEVYTMIDRRHFRREIALAHHKAWGGAKNRSLWQHWRHQSYRATKKD
jgi:hypothetical protein